MAPAVKRTLAIICVAAVVLVLAALFVGQWYIRSLSGRARLRAIADLQDRFDGDVQLRSLNLHLFPQPSVSGDGLSIRHRGWPADHPLLAIRHFSATATFWDLLYQRDRIDLLRLEGLEVHLPPVGKSAEQNTREDEHDVASATPGNDKTQLKISIRHIIADGAFLEIEPKQPGNTALQFPIEKLSLWSVGPGQPLSFKGRLTNAKPPGAIDTQGKFGPWQRDDPRSTAVFGTYQFRNADLGVFAGISGTLSSEGSYTGVLQHIEVNGATDTPNFTLKRGGAPVDLRTRFHAIVNGTDGDTLLEPVDATFLHSRFVCRGGIVKNVGDKAKTLNLNAVAKDSRIEDIILLVTGDRTPFIKGQVDFRTTILIPPGNQDVLNKLQLWGRFDLSSAHFQSPKVEQRLLTLSDRARGITKSKEEDQPPTTVASNLFGVFRMGNGSIRFSKLQFSVPGAQIRLAGDYNLQTQQMDFNGVFRMQATLAETQSGIKRYLLIPFNPLFQKDGAGFQVPLTVAGNRRHPDLSVTVFHHRFDLN